MGDMGAYGYKIYVLYEIRNKEYINNILWIYNIKLL